MQKAKIKIVISVLIIFVFGFLIGIGVTKFSSSNNETVVVPQVEPGLSEEEIAEINNEINRLESEKTKIENIKNDEFLMLVNRDDDKRVDKDYKSANLVKSKLPIKSYQRTQYLDKTVDDSAVQMFNDAKNQGIYLYGFSLYRSYDEQNQIYSTKVSSIGKEQTELYSAPPGASEHQTGLAFDLVASNYTKLEEGFENTKAFKWLSENCEKYGFIMRYPRTKEEITGYQYEPWHYRYVGVDNATKIKSSNMCLEEYITDLNNQVLDIDKKIEVLKDKKK